MNNSLQPSPINPTVFHFQGHPIREITDEHGNPWFVVKDVCDILGLDHITNALIKVPEQHLTVIRLQSGGQMREMKIIDEPGLYRLVLRSDKPQAEPFMEWVTSEVLPSIRKTGSYTVPGLGANNAMEAMAGQIIGMVIPAVISQVMNQVIPMFQGLQKKVEAVQINFSHTGTVWSFHYHCCQEGSTNTYVEKDELYAAYCAYCASIPYCRPEGKSAFLTKIYQAFHNTCAATINQGGRKVQAVRGLALLPGYENIIEDCCRKRQGKDAAELARRREHLCGVALPGPEVQA